MAGIFDWLVGGAGTTVTAAADAVGGLAQNIRSVITGDFTPDQKIKLEQMAQAADAVQAQINNTEASSSSMFTSGARPAILWVCAFGFFYVCTFPLIAWTAMILHLPVPPAMDNSIFMPVMMGMLGLGGMRTIEKYTGCQNNH
jgi:hypothetical protein